jgi:hypothetical protein
MVEEETLLPSIPFQRHSRQAGALLDSEFQFDDDRFRGGLGGIEACTYV